MNRLSLGYFSCRSGVHTSPILIKRRDLYKVHVRSSPFKKKTHCVRAPNGVAFAMWRQWMGRKIKIHLSKREFAPAFVSFTDAHAGQTTFGCYFSIYFISFFHHSSNRAPRNPSGLVSRMGIVCLFVQVCECVCARAFQCDFISYWFYVRRHFYRLFTFRFSFFFFRSWVG